MPLTYTVPTEGLEPRQLILATWVDHLVHAAPTEFEDLTLDDFCLALVMCFKLDLEEVLTACMGNTKEVRQ